MWDFLGGPVVNNPPCNVGDAHSIPERGTKIPHATEQLSSQAATTEPVHYKQRIHGSQGKKILSAATKTNAAK